MVTVPAFGLARYTLRRSDSNALHSISAVTLYNSLPSHYEAGYVLVSRWLISHFVLCEILNQMISLRHTLVKQELVYIVLDYITHN